MSQLTRLPGPAGLAGPARPVRLAQLAELAQVTWLSCAEFRHTLQAKRHGFDGKACLHPDQLAIVGRCLRPTMPELAWAARIDHARRVGALHTMSRRVLGDDATPEADRNTDGMAIVEGVLVGPPRVLPLALRFWPFQPLLPAWGTFRGSLALEFLGGVV